MKTGFFKNLVLSIFLSVSFMACEKEDVLLNEPFDVEKQEVYVKNGRLVFKNKESFNNTFNSISKMDEAKRKEWLNQFSKLKTYRATNQAYKINTPAWLTTVLNEDGVFQVGDTIIVMGKESEYYIPAENEGLLAKVLNSIESGEVVLQEQGLTVFKEEMSKTHEVKEISTQGNHIQGELAVIKPIPGEYEHKFVWGKGTYRFVVRSYVYWDQLSGLTPHVESGLEYWYSRWYVRDHWERAGQIVEKTFSYYEFSDINFTAPIFSYPGAYTVTNNSYHAIMSSYPYNYYGSCAKPTIKGYAFLKINEPAHPNWKEEFRVTFDFRSTKCY